MSHCHRREILNFITIMLPPIISTNKKPSYPQLLTRIFVIGLLCRLFFVFCTPTFYAPDEQAHYKYVQYIATEHNLPIQTSATGAATNDWEYYQPPLYYLALVPIYSIAESLHLSEKMTVTLLRSVSILLWGLAAFFTLQLMKSLEINDTFLSVFMVSMISLLPTYTFLSSVINNDNLVIALGTAILYVASKPTSIKNALICGFLIGLAMLTKLTAIVYAVLISAIFFLELAKGEQRKEKILCFALTSIIAMALWAPWSWRNLIIYGSITAEEIANVPREWKSTSQAIWSTLRYLQRSFWSVSGIYNNINSFFPNIGRTLTYISLLGFLIALLPSRRRQKEHLIYFRAHNVFWLASLIAIAVNLALVFRFSLLYGQGQGRFLFPLLIPIAFYLGSGLKVYRWSHSEKSLTRLAYFFMVYALSFMLYSVREFTKT